MLRRIERPTTTTLRPASTPTSIACCIRWMFEAKLEMRIRPRRTGMIWRKASPTTRSERVKPARSAFVESPSSRSTPRLPSAASRPTSVRSPSTGVWSSFQSPLWKTSPAAVSIAIPTASGIECAMRMNSRVNGPSSTGPLSGSASRSSAARSSPCSSSFDLTSPSVRRVAQISCDADLAQEERQRADVILVGVGQDDGAHALVAQVAEVGEDHVDSEMLVARERHAGVDDDDLVAELVNGHVLSHLAEPAERDHA